MAFRLPEGVLPTEAEFNCSFDHLDHLIACAKQGIAPGELWCPHGVAIDTATNHIYVAEGDRTYNIARVSVFSDNGDYLNSFSHDNIRSLWGIAIHGNNVYVTDDSVHAVFHFKIESDFRLLVYIGSRGSELGQFLNPCQLSVHTNGDVYVADSYNHRIQILDSSLHPIRAIKHPSMHYPRDVKLTIEEMYVLSYRDTSFVHVFSHTGHKIRSLITDSDVTRPYFFCLGANNLLYISDWDADQIKIFSKEGTLLHTLGEHGQTVGMFDGLFGLAVTSNLKLVTLSWNENYILRIFSYV